MTSLMIFLFLNYLVYFTKRGLELTSTLFYWPIEKVLHFLKSWHPADQFSLKQLTIKTLALIAITTSDRGQTLHSKNIKKMHISYNSISFIISNKLKNTKRVLKPKIVKWFNSSDPALDVCVYAKRYMFETSKFRNENHYFHQLFSSWATKKPVTKVSLARWLISVLPSSGIDTKVFSVHSYRGVSLSTACNNGVTLNDILKVGDWTNADTFLNQYYAHVSRTPVGQIILNESPLEG